MTTLLYVWYSFPWQAKVYFFDENIYIAWSLMIGRLRFNFNAIDQWRKLNDWTLEQTAAAIHVDQSLLSLMKHGKRLPSHATLEKICRATGLEIGKLLVFDRTDPEDDEFKETG